MNFFEQELRKIMKGEETSFIGRNCYVSITKNLKMKIFFTTLRVYEHYEGLKIEIIDKNTNGLIDSTLIRFKELFGKKQINNNLSVNPHIWLYEEEYEWYAYTPSEKEYKQLREEIIKYKKLFEESKPIEENQYLTFVLGYDLLKSLITPMECDIAFELCKNFINIFLESEEYSNLRLSAYDALVLWIKNNDSFIKQTVNKKKIENKTLINHLKEIMKDCLEIRGYQATEEKIDELWEIYEDCQEWENEKMITGKTFNEIEDFIKHSSCIEEILTDGGGEK